MVTCLFVCSAVFDSPGGFLPLVQTVVLKYSLETPSLRAVPPSVVLCESWGSASLCLDECRWLRASSGGWSQISASLDFLIYVFPPAWRANLAAAGADWFLNIGKSCCGNFWDRSDKSKAEKLLRYQKVVAEGQFYVGLYNLSSCYNFNERLNLPFSVQISSNQSSGEESYQMCRVSIYLFIFE